MPAKKTKTTKKKTKVKAKMNPSETPISRHKTTPARLETPQPAAASPVFDIIPRTRVRPSASSRPVITGTQPMVADTTLKQPVEPQLDLKQPSLDAPAPKKQAAPEEKGVSISELMAKKQAEAPVAPAPEADAVATVPAPEEEKPVGEPEKSAEATMVHEKVIEPPKTADTQPAADEASEKTSQSAKNESKADDLVAEDSLAATLKDDSDQPQEQSDALKDAIKEAETDLRHHALYEGKPVIVIHKRHGKHPALTWTLLFLFCLLLALVAVNFLLDAEVISTDYVIPHTNIL